jgi:hypothetical protein
LAADTTTTVPTIDKFSPLTGPLSIQIGSENLSLNRIELNSFSDNVVNGNAVAPLSVDYSVFELG